ncbi:protein of unknown function [Legionella hackeliae]|uniref:Uncharacterized protein n=1 Tax=Legionella hackeliae TaxID=449 RepID=A0A0A8UUM5_LEGHA|nr:protein of unknown function [Legionella hackeliae]
MSEDIEDVGVEEELEFSLVAAANAVCPRTNDNTRATSDIFFILLSLVKVIIRLPATIIDADFKFVLESIIYNKKY